MNVLKSRELGDRDSRFFERPSYKNVQTEIFRPISPVGMVDSYSKDLVNISNSLEFGLGLNNKPLRQKSKNNSRDRSKEFVFSTLQNNTDMSYARCLPARNTNTIEYNQKFVSGHNYRTNVEQYERLHRNSLEDFTKMRNLDFNKPVTTPFTAESRPQSQNNPSY